MIIDFNVQMVGPDCYLVTAIMFEEPPREVGMFEDEEDIDEACRLFAAAFVRRLH